MRPTNMTEHGQSLGGAGGPGGRNTEAFSTAGRTLESDRLALDPNKTTDSCTVRKGMC